MVSPTGDVTATELARSANLVRRRMREARKSAVGTMSPAAMRKAVLRGEIDPADAVLWGESENGPFTEKDVKAFSLRAKKIEEEFRGKDRSSKRTGVPIDQLVAASLPDDVKRANDQIRNVGIYRIDGDVLHIRTNASSGSDSTHHFLRIRLVNWVSELSSGRKSIRASVNNALRGPVQFDCDCGRNQYWFRYVATIAGAALTQETGFPKIRNATLAGMCCKHTLSAFKRLFSPMTVTMLSQAMEQQANKIGFVGDVGRVSMSKEDIARMEKASARAIDQQAFIKSIQRRTGQAKAKKRKDPAYAKKLEREIRDLKRQLKAEKQSSQHLAAGLKERLRTEIDRAKIYNSSKQQAIKFFAQENGMSIDEVAKLAEDL